MNFIPGEEMLCEENRSAKVASVGKHYDASWYACWQCGSSRSMNVAAWAACVWTAERGAITKLQAAAAIIGKDKGLD